MRLTNRLSTILKTIGIEICILALIGLVFLFQFDKAKNEFVSKTRAISETIGDLASDFYSEEGHVPASGGFYHFLDKRLGRKKLFNTFEIAPKFFSVVFRDDFMGKSESNNNLFLSEFYPEGGFSVRDTDGVISVSVPFSTRMETEPFGIVKIDSDTKSILKRVFADNYLLYLAMLIVLNNQAFILYLLMKRKKEVVFDKGYLREHSIGALKIMHKVLGDIIQDHKTDVEYVEHKENAGKIHGSSKNVISISDLAENRKK